MVGIRIKCWKKNYYEPWCPQVCNERAKIPHHLCENEGETSNTKISPCFTWSFHPTYSLTIALHPLVSKYCVYYVSASVFSKYHKDFYHKVEYERQKYHNVE